MYTNTGTDMNGPPNSKIDSRVQELKTRKSLIEKELLLYENGNIKTSSFIDGKLVSANRITPLPNGAFADIWDLPEDQSVFRDICEGKTETVFQMNTPGALQWLREFDYVKSTDTAGDAHKGLDSIEALAAFTALDRPGPLDFFVEDKDGKKHNMLVEYARRVRGEEPVGSLPILDELLPETKGTIIYQEALQRIFQHVGHTTAEEADEFRVHISKKQTKKVMEDRKVFDRGAIPMLGEEQAANLWTSMEKFSQYGFNKSHAVCYVVISYACAYLKHYYPLEWWTAVLRNAGKNEINDTFWGHCGHMIDLPDVNLSADQFEIKKERIRAPVTLLLGIGEKAHQQLCAGRPYADINDFCHKIEAFKKANTTVVQDEQGNTVMVEDKKTKTMVPKTRAGHSALNKTVVGTLIVSGAMDSLFPPDTGTVDQLGMYFEAVAKASKKRKIEAVPAKYLHLDAMIRFQMRKAVLPAYSENLFPHLKCIKIPGFSYPADNERAYFRPSPKHWVPFVTGKEIGLIEGLPKAWSDKIVMGPDSVLIFDRSDCEPPFPGANAPTPKIHMAVIAYVVEQRNFSYGDKKKACELILDIDGKRLKAVKWPGYDTGELPDYFKKEMSGSVALVLLSKREGKIIGIDDIKVIQPALPKKESEE